MLIGCRVAVCALLLSACGSAPPRDTNARHADIQRHEAALERALVEGARAHETIAVEPSEAGCSALAVAVTEAGEAAGRVCEIAREARDPDARLRCERARRRATDATAGWSPCVQRPDAEAAPPG